MKAIPMIVSEEDIKILKQGYKDNDIDIIKSYNIPALTSEYYKQKEKGKSIQSGIISEIIVCASIAKYYNMTLDTSDNDYRYVYRHKNNILYQDGRPNSNDAIFLFDDKRYVLEIKEPMAKCGEKDLTYDENGKLIPSKSICESFPEYLPFIDYYNKTTSIFNNRGHNFKLNESQCKEIFVSYFILKNVDYYVSYKNNYIYIININDLSKYINCRNSEIRTTGRNPKLVFTPKLRDKTLQEKGAIFVDDKVIIPLSNITPVIGRGKKNITRYKIDEFFALKVEKIINQDSDNITCALKNIIQIKPTISIHINLEV